MCVNHSYRQSVARCCNCGNNICAECLVELANGDIVCKSCIEKSTLQNTKILRDKPYYAPPASDTKLRKFSSFLLFIFSCLPGAGHMYLGLMKRGLLIMSAFFMVIYFSSISYYSTVFIFAIPVIWFASFFDSFNIKRKLNDGLVVEDSVDFIIKFISTNRHIILLAGVTLFIIEFISSRGSFFKIPFPSLIIIFIGIILIIKSKKHY